MNTALATTRGNTNSGGVQSCTREGTIDPVLDAVMRVARVCFAGKVIETLHQITGAAHRTVKYWQSLKREPSMLDGAKLLQTDAGFDFLVAMMGDAMPDWWVAFMDHMDVVEAERLQALAQERMAARAAKQLKNTRLLSGAINAAKNTTAARGRAAAILHRADTHSGRSAQHLGGGLRDRTMASAKLRDATG